jgi:hypothetical protein
MQRDREEEYYILSATGELQSVHQNLEECLDAIQELDNSFTNTLDRFLARLRPYRPFRRLYHIFMPLREPGELPEPCTQVLNDIGTHRIQSLTLVRKPLSPFVRFLLNGLTFNRFKIAMEQNHYDKMYHLMLIIQTTENQDFVWEKTHVVQLRPLRSKLISSEALSVTYPANAITVEDLVNRTRDHMGRGRFSEYDGFTNNCQDFISATLDSLGLSTQETRYFIQQDVLGILRTLLEHGSSRWFVPVQHKITSFVARLNRLENTYCGWFLSWSRNFLNRRSTVLSSDVVIEDSAGVVNDRADHAVEVRIGQSI